MTYKEKKRSMFLGLPWTFTTYTVTDEFISIDSGLLNKVEGNRCPPGNHSDGTNPWYRHHPLLHR